MKRNMIKETQAENWSFLGNEKINSLWLEINACYRRLRGHKCREKNSLDLILQVMENYILGFVTRNVMYLELCIRKINL